MNRSLQKVVITLAGMLVLQACGGPQKPAVNPATLPVPVNVVKVIPGKALFFDKYPGTVVALMQVDLRPQVAGYITGIYFKEGDHVVRGQKLYTIDDTKYQASVNQAEANVRVAQSNLDQAQKDADRYVYLNEHEAVAKQVLDHAITTLQNAKDQLTAAKQDVARAKTDLDYSVIRAPFEGTIGISQVKLGNSVTPGVTVMNTISTDDPMAVDIVVNEKQIGRFQRLKEVGQNEADSLFTLVLPDNSIYKLPGKIALLDRGVDPTTGALTVRLNFKNSGGLLRAGMSCAVRVKNDDTSQQLLVPSKAIVEQMGEFFVFIAKDTAIAGPADTAKNGAAIPPKPHALQKKVQLAQTVGDRVIVRSGLQGGEDLIVDGVQKLHQGSLILIGAPGAKPQGK